MALVQVRRANGDRGEQLADERISELHMTGQTPLIDGGIVYR